jgi:hypothetical protein
LDCLSPNFIAGATPPPASQIVNEFMNEARRNGQDGPERSDGLDGRVIVTYT